MHTGQELFTLSKFAEPMIPVPLTFSPDGKTLAAATDSPKGSKIYLWSAQESSIFQATEQRIASREKVGLGQEGHGGGN